MIYCVIVSMLCLLEPSVTVTVNNRPNRIIEKDYHAHMFCNLSTLHLSKAWLTICVVFHQRVEIHTNVVFPELYNLVGDRAEAGLKRLV